MAWIPCQCCGQEFGTGVSLWYVCDTCGYRVCMNCLSKHTGPYGVGFKCSQCAHGQMVFRTI